MISISDAMTVVYMSVEKKMINRNLTLTLPVKFPYYGVYEDIRRGNMPSPHGHCESLFPNT